MSTMVTSRDDWLKMQFDYIETMLSRGYPAVFRKAQDGKTVKYVIYPERLDEFHELMGNFGCGITLAAVWARIGVVEEED